MRKSVCLLFINNRLVQCSAIKRSLENLYSLYLPKSTHPFVYLSLSIPGPNIDVNVHPTKQEVHFLYEEEIVDLVVWAVEQELKGANNSRTFYAQTLLTTNRPPDVQPKSPVPHNAKSSDASASALQKRKTSSAAAVSDQGFHVG